MAEAQAEALSGVFDANLEHLPTRQDIEIALAPLRKDIALLKWMGGLIVAGVLALVLKSFF